METLNQKLTRLRAAVEQAQNDLIEAEAKLADRRAEVNAFELEFEARVGYLLDRLSALEADIERYNDLVETVRNRQVFGNAYLSVARQYQRTWTRPKKSAPVPPATPPSPATEAEIKRLYRQLARAFHPDLAANEGDRLRRTEKMTAINDAYAARSLAELIRLAQGIDNAHSIAPGQTTIEMVQVLETELARCRRRVREIEIELQNIHRSPSVQLSIEVKLARRRGEDLLHKVGGDLEKQIARKTVERDLLKAQIDQLGPDQGIIPINRS